MNTEATLPAMPNDSLYRQAMGLGIGIWDYFEKNQREIGDTFTLKLPGQGPMVWTADPTVVKDVLRLKEMQYDATLLQLPIDTGEDATVYLNEKEHQNARKLIIPPFNTKQLDARLDVMGEIISEHVDRLRPGQQMDFPRWVGDVTIDIICYTILNLREGERMELYKERMLGWVAEATSDLMFGLGAAVGARRFRRWLHQKYQRRLQKGKPGNGKKGLFPWKRAVDLKVQLAGMIIEDVDAIRKRADENETHVLAIFAKAKDSNGNLLSYERIISETTALLIAGHETSAATAAWMMIWMQQNPQVYNNIQAEALDTIKKNNRIHSKELAELPYITACLNESQRLTPSAPGFIRWLREDTKLGDLHLPAGTAILPNMYLLHRKESIYGADAKEYKPERWLGENKRKFSPWEFLPFGGGARACVGMNQGRQQLRMIFSELARRVEFESEFQHSTTLPRSRVIGGQTEPEKGVPLRVVSISHKTVGLH